jgi:hypothetical protein
VFIWLAWFAVIAAMRTVSFTSFGEYISDLQPILVWALVNGVVSAAAIATFWIVSSAFLARRRGPGRPIRSFVIWSLASGGVLVSLLVVICCLAGLSVPIMLRYWWTFALGQSAIIGLLGAITPRQD